MAHTLPRLSLLYACVVFGGCWITCMNAQALRRRANVFSPHDHAHNFTPHKGSDKHPCPLVDLHSLAERKYVVLISTDAHYLPVFLNWLLFYVDTCSSLEHVRVICLDETTVEAIAIWGGEWGMECVIPEKKLVHHSALWLYRIKVVSSFLEHGIDVVQTDSDALWLRNPIPYVQTPASIAGSLGSFPPNSEEKFGASFCMGWIYFKSDVITSKLMTSLYQKMSKTHMTDDQREFNNMLVNEWSLASDFQRLTRLNRTNERVEITSMQNVAGDVLTVAFLPDRLFRRHCDGIPDDELRLSAVLHCLVHEKAGTAKVEGQKGIGMWRLVEGWEKSAPNKTVDDLSQYLSPIRNHEWRR